MWLFLGNGYEILIIIHLKEEYDRSFTYYSYKIVTVQISSFQKCFLPFQLRFFLYRNKGLTIFPWTFFFLAILMNSLLSKAWFNRSYSRLVVPVRTTSVDWWLLSQVLSAVWVPECEHAEVLWFIRPHKFKWLLGNLLV